MNTKIFSCLAAAALALGFSACSDDDWNPKTSNEGQLSLKSMALEVVDAQKDIETNKGRASADDTSSFLVEIYDAQGALAYNWTYSSMPEIVTLPVGDYTVKAYSHKVQKAEWEGRYYEGSRSFKIENNKITEIEPVVCKFANIAVTIKFDDKLKEAMADDAKVTVIANDEGSLEFGKNETRTGYFQYVDASMTLIATFSGKVQGYDEEIRVPLTDIEAGQHRIITFTLKKGDPTVPGESGTISPDQGFNVDYTMEKVDIDGNVTVEEDPADNVVDRPVHEDPKVDPEDPDKPNPPVDPSDNPEKYIQVKSDDVHFADEDSTPNPVVAGNNYVVNIHSEKGVKNLLVKIESTSASFIQSVGELMPTEFDLANPDTDEYPELGDALASIGLKVKGDVLDQTDVPFDITGLVPLLAGFPGTHTFSITVVDAAGNKVSKSIVFKS